MPETLKGLFSKRTYTWASGGANLLRYLPKMMRWKKRRMWYICSGIYHQRCWVATVGVVLLWALEDSFSSRLSVAYAACCQGDWRYYPRTCLLQVLVGMIIDSRYERGLHVITTGLSGIHWRTAAIIECCYNSWMVSPKVLLKERSNEQYGKVGYSQSRDNCRLSTLNIDGER